MSWKVFIYRNVSLRDDCRCYKNQNQPQEFVERRFAVSLSSWDDRFFCKRCGKELLIITVHPLTSFKNP